jgi:hypothetical protein
VFFVVNHHIDSLFFYHEGHEEREDYKTILLIPSFNFILRVLRALRGE